MITVRMHTPRLSTLPFISSMDANLPAIILLIPISENLVGKKVVIY